MTEEMNIGMALTCPAGEIVFYHITSEQFEKAYDLKHPNKYEWADAIEHLFPSRFEAELAIIIIGGANNYKR